jgi:hypothetical protein
VVENPASGYLKIQPCMRELNSLRARVGLMRGPADLRSSACAGTSEERAALESTTSRRCCRASPRWTPRSPPLCPAGLRRCTCTIGSTSVSLALEVRWGRGAACGDLKKKIWLEGEGPRSPTQTLPHVRCPPHTLPQRSEPHTAMSRCTARGLAADGRRGGLGGL